MASEEKYDSAFLAILQNEGKIPSFLEELFSFLYRRTDFFVVMKTQNEKMGFPPGVAIKLVVDAFKKFETMAKKVAERKERLQREREAQAKLTEVVDMETVSPVVCEVEIRTENNQDENPGQGSMETDSQTRSASSLQSRDEKTDNSVQSQLKLLETDSEESVRNKGDLKVGKKDDGEISESGVGNRLSGESDQNDRKTADIDRKAVDKNDQKTAETQESGTNQDRKDKGDSGTKTDGRTTDEEDDPELTKQQKEFQSHPESYNGAIRDNYCWAQSITDVDVRITVPAYIKRGKDVSVTISRKHLKASCKTDTGGIKTLVDGALTWAVRQEECMWSLVPGEHIHVSLEKVQERWWEGVLTDEPKISVRKIDPSRPITDLDDEAQAKISEMMFNDEQKRLGKPQSHEVKVHDMLKNAWDAQGSPFKGTPYDPSKVNVAQGGTMGLPQ